MTVLLPPWVITRSTLGRISVWGRNSAPAMLSASSNSVVLRALGDDEAVGRVGQLGDQLLHQLDVGRAERAEAEVDQRLLAVAQRLRQLPGRVGRPDARLQVVPGRAERFGAPVVDLVGIEVHVQPGALVDEVVGWQRRRAALLAEGAEVGVHLPVGVAVGAPVLVPAAACRRWAGRRTAAAPAASFISVGLQDMIRAHGRPQAGSAGKATTLSSTIRSGCSSSMISRSRSSTYFAPSISAWKVGGDEARQLLLGRGAEDRRRVADEVLPELARRFLGLRRRRQPHQPLLEPLGLERPGEGLLDDEDDPVAAPAQDVADADAVVGRPERPLGEEDDRRALLAHAPIVRTSNRRRHPFPAVYLLLPMTATVEILAKLGHFNQDAATTMAVVLLAVVVFAYWILKD